VARATYRLRGEAYDPPDCGTRSQGNVSQGRYMSRLRPVALLVTRTFFSRRLSQYVNLVVLCGSFVSFGFFRRHIAAYNGHYNYYVIACDYTMHYDNFK